MILSSRLTRILSRQSCSSVESCTYCIHCSRWSGIYSSDSDNESNSSSSELLSYCSYCLRRHEIYSSESEYEMYMPSSFSDSDGCSSSSGSSCKSYTYSSIKSKSSSDSSSSISLTTESSSGDRCYDSSNETFTATVRKAFKKLGFDLQDINSETIVPEEIECQLSSDLKVE